MKLRVGLAGTATVYVFAAALQKAAPFLLLLLLARSVSVDTFGQIGVLTSLYVLTLVVGGLGLESAAFRGEFVSRGPTDSADYYGTLSKLAVLGPLTLSAAVGAWLLLVPRTVVGIDASAVGLVVIGACLFAAGTTVPLARLRAQERVGWYVVCYLVPTFVQVAAKLVLVVGLDLGASGWAMGDIAGGLSALALTARFQVRDLIAWPPSSRVALSVLRLSLPLLPHVVSSWALSLSDRLLIAGLVGITAAGQYGLVAQLASVGMILSTELNRALSPEYGRVIHGEEGAEARLRRVVDLQRLVSVPVFALTAAGCLGFVYFLAPAAYRDGAGWALVLCAGLLAYSWYYPAMNVLSISEGRTSGMPFITLSAAGANVLANVLLLREHGPAVAAYSTVGGYVLLLVFTSVYAGRRDALKWRARTLAVGAVAFAGLVTAGTVLIVSGS